MNKICKKLTAFLCGLTACVMTIVGFYSENLPDSFEISEGENIMINSKNSLFSVSAKPATNYDKTADCKSGKNSSRKNSTLMLFGKVPIKDVTTKEITRPMLIPCGQAFGIKLISDGVMFIDTATVEGKSPAQESGIRQGDIIVSINGEKIRSNEDISEIISNSQGRPCNVLFTRKGNSKEVSLTPVLSSGIYKAGLWVRDSSAGIGTLTFYDEKTGFFGGLGHPICDSDTKEILPLSKGIAGMVKITGCTKSYKGNPGQLLGEFTSDDSMGEITSNCENGIFGNLRENPSSQRAIPLGFRQEIHTGKAEILSSIDGKEPKKYSVEIEKINLGENAQHDLVIKVTDPTLIAKTGGIVQGMSGSPIIQDGRLVGAVTHVFVDDPTMGYGIFAESMYNQEAVEKAG